MKIKEYIKQFFEEQPKGFTISKKDLAKELEIAHQDYQLFFQALNVLVREASLIKTNNKYTLATSVEQTVGVLRMHPKGFGFVVVEGEEDDLFVAKQDIGPAFDGDTVLVKKVVDRMDATKFSAKILEVTKHSDKPIVGVVEKFNKNYFKVTPDNQSLLADLYIKKSEHKHVVIGHKIVGKIADVPYGQKIILDVLEVLGHVNDPGVDILSIVREHEIPSAFPAEVYEELNNATLSVTDADLVGRLDLTNEYIITIDGSDAKDLDDAISLTKKDEHFHLGVHIADVTHYVDAQAPIDLEAYNRGTSVYLADRVIPMLPEQLSNGICSLLPGELRLAVTCKMEIDLHGTVINSSVHRSFLNVNERMTYDDVNCLLNKKDKAVLEKYANDVELYENMKELSDILEFKRTKRGALDFDINEAKIVVDETGKATGVELRKRGAAEKVIESFMIQANEVVAEMFSQRELASIYRVHDLPKNTQINVFKEVARGFGVNVSHLKDLATVEPLVFQEILAQVGKKEEHSLLSTLLLKAMNKAEYQTKNIGHFGLGSKMYTHFTSPIRRYPDLMIHRLLKFYIIDGNTEPTVLLNKDSLDEISKHTSITERRAVECERDVEQMKMAEYMEDKVGGTFDGIISGVTNGAIFVELPNLIEGRIALETLNDDYYIFVPEKMLLYGRRTNNKLQLGDKVKVLLVAASKESASITFELLAQLDKTKQKANRKSQQKHGYRNESHQQRKNKNKKRNYNRSNKAKKKTQQR